MDKQKKLVDKIIEGIQEKKGKDIVIADLTPIDDTICNYFIVCQGNSPSHLEALAQSIAYTVHRDLNEKPVAVDGFRNAEWIAIDYVDVMVHIFLPERHDFYNIENLWADAQLTQIPNID